VQILSTRYRGVVDLKAHLGLVAGGSCRLARCHKTEPVLEQILVIVCMQNNAINKKEVQSVKQKKSYCCKGVLLGKFVEIQCNCHMLKPAQIDVLCDC